MPRATPVFLPRCSKSLFERCNPLWTLGPRRGTTDSGNQIICGMCEDSRIRQIQIWALAFLSAFGQVNSSPQLSFSLGNTHTLWKQDLPHRFYKVKVLKTKGLM